MRYNWTMPPDDRNRIEDLKRSLYSRDAPDVRTRRKLRFSDQVSEVKTDWEHPPESTEPKGAPSDFGAQKKTGMTFSTKLFIASLVFFVLAVGAGAYIFLNGANLISANNIDIAVSGPVSIPGGTPVALTVTVTNKNSVTLKTVDLAVHFPAGTTDPNDTTLSLDTHQENLGDIQPGASVTKTVKAVIFGEENIQKEVKADVTYSIAGSSSVFTKEQVYDVLINSSPVVISATAFNEITSGQPFDLTIQVKSDSGNTLKSVLVKAVYPFGFAFDSASPSPSASDNTAWSIGDMPPGGSRTITIHGKLTGEDNDLRAFHFSVGAQSASDPLAIGTAFTETEKDITIKKPFVSLAFAMDSDSGQADFVTKYGHSVNTVVRWTNNLPQTLSNMVITVHLSGSAYDKTQVSASGGYFRSATDDMVWNQQTNPELASVAAGATGNLTFMFAPTDHGSASNPVVDPVVVLSGTVTGDRTSESNVPDNTSEITRTAKISSDISLSGRIMRASGPFVNSGPIPPVAEQKTTYTVVWTVDNSSNAVKNAVVTATLPPYVTWANQTSPSTEDVSYDTNSGTVTWNIGTMNAPLPGQSSRREADFQISFQPSVDQVGQSPLLVNRATLSAVDGFTNASLDSSQDYLTPSFSTDSSFRRGNEIVSPK